MSDNDNITFPVVPTLPSMLEELEKKRLARADNEDEAAKPQKNKHPIAKQIALEDEKHLTTCELGWLQSNTIEQGKQRNGKQYSKSQGGCIATNSQFPIS